MSEKADNTKNTTNTTMWVAFFGLFTSLGTILCCALPALLVTLGMGAVMAGLVSAAPWITVLSTYKVPVFIVTGIVLLVSALLQWRGRYAPCPVDPVQAKLCRVMRRFSIGITAVSIVLYLVGFFFAFLAVYFL